VRAGGEPGAADVLDAAPGRLRVRLDGAAVDATWSADVPWPRTRAFGGLGPAQAVPSLGQHWHPHLLLGAARGSVTLGGVATSLDGATVYAEKNWGSAFAGHWWWGQAHGLGDGAACVAFAGRRLLGQAPTALVVALDGELLRLSPPLSAVTTSTAPGHWRIRAGGVVVEAEADPSAAHLLPVPVPAERRVVVRSAQQLAGRLAVTVRRSGRVHFRGETELAGLERGVPA
ncbi:MAG: tocopherol cyclase family protein, partial [Solirubrobacteraceae bacterium]